ncbi:MAG: cell division protein FtsQ/DivIB [Bacteroidota bacterium]
MKKVVRIILWVLIIAWFFVMMGFVSSREQAVICSRVEVILADSSDLGFITKAGVNRMISRKAPGLIGKAMDEIDMNAIETAISENPFIKSADVYGTVSGTLGVRIEQRQPVVRVMPNGSSGFYIDREGAVMPVTPGFSPMLLLATGDIDFPADLLKRGNIGSFSEEEKKMYPALFDIVDFADYIGKKSFWKNQIVQIYLNRSGDWELIPRVGAHQIILGPMEGYREKLEKLLLLYKQGLPEYGWNTYDKINLKYSNQIICSKR